MLPIMNCVRRLHIGANERKDGWEVFSIVPSEIVDHVGDARELSRFFDNTFYELYASHVLEHFEHFEYFNEVSEVLLEWKRVLVPGGRLMISVPNLDALCYLYSHEKVTTLEDKYTIMRLIFGAHSDPYDYHKSGFFPELLTKYLREAGFEHVHTLDNFGLFKDCSAVKCAGVPISLNMSAYKPKGWS